MKMNQEILKIIFVISFSIICESIEIVVHKKELPNENNHSEHTEVLNDEPAIDSSRSQSDVIRYMNQLSRPYLRPQLKQANAQPNLPRPYWTPGARGVSSPSEGILDGQGNVQPNLSQPYWNPGAPGISSPGSSSPGISSPQSSNFYTPVEASSPMNGFSETQNNEQYNPSLFYQSPNTQDTRVFTYQPDGNTSLSQDEMNSLRSQNYVGYMKPGKCPTIGCLYPFSADPIQACEIDFHCSGRNKCCEDPCLSLKICSIPEHIHLGTCPLQEACDANLVYTLFCVGDVHCPQDEKCCFDKCYGQYMCKKSNNNETTTTTTTTIATPTETTTIATPTETTTKSSPEETTTTTISPNRCKFLCPGTLQCCDQVLKPGYCPSSSLCYPASLMTMIRRNLQNCVSDFQCRRTEKCCYDQCHRLFVCRPVVLSPIDHPGQCPATPSVCNLPNLNNLISCLNDEHCPLHERCCNTPCTQSKICKRALNGLPPPTTGTPPSSIPGQNSCKNFCPGSSQCCDEVDKSGFCPAPAKCRVGYIGNMKPFRYKTSKAISKNTQKICLVDYDCSGDAKCCYDPCVLRKVCRASVPSPYVHYGTCPPPRLVCSGPFVPNNRFETCNSDADCWIDHKCCYDQCSTTIRCMSPLESRINGTTPAPPTTKPCLFLCPDNSGCCDDVFKLGFCPVESRCKVSPSDSPKICSKDYGCPGDEKCCYDNCHRMMICRPSVESNITHPGICPHNDQFPCPDPPSPSSLSKFRCTDDRGCLHEERCCLDMCLKERVCENSTQLDTTTQKPETTTAATGGCNLLQQYPSYDGGPKPGVCPPSSKCVGTMKTQPERCKEDCDCPGSEKCCYDDCQKQNYCRPLDQPVQNKVFCPAQSTCEPSGQPIYNSNCADDSSCSGTSKCCFDNCAGKSVCKPKVSNSKFHPGVCPVDTSNICNTNPTSVQTKCRGMDSECRAKERCCYIACKTDYYCIAAERELPPPVNLPTKTPSTPSNCTLKCLDGTCCDGVPKPNFCPADYNCTGVIRILEKECTQDYNCPNEEKCCKDSCLNKSVCRPGVSDSNDHPGSCPTHTLSNANFGPRIEDECVGDSDCLLDQKCCSVKGEQGKKCQKSNHSFGYLKRCDLPCQDSDVHCCDNGTKM